jgi:hypothetical protein
VKPDILRPDDKGEDMRIGIAADHGGFGLKEDLRSRLTAAGHEAVGFGATGSSQAATTRISLLRWRGQSRQAE